MYALYTCVSASICRETRAAAFNDDVYNVMYQLRACMSREHMTCSGHRWLGWPSLVPSPSHVLNVTRRRLGMRLQVHAYNVAYWTCRELQSCWLDLENEWNHHISWKNFKAFLISQWSRRLQNTSTLIRAHVHSDVCSIYSINTWLGNFHTEVKYYRDCREVLEKGVACSGVYTIKPDHLPPFEVSELIGTHVQSYMYTVAIAGKFTGWFDSLYTFMIAKSNLAT